MKIGVDLDDVLSQSTPALIKFHNDNYGTDFKIENLKTYKLLTILGSNKERAQKKLSEFHTSSYGREAKPITDARKILQKLKKGNDFYVITARTDDLEVETRRWIKDNYPNIFSEIYLTNEFLKKNPSVTKKTVCDNLGIDVFIEDNLDYAIECIGPGRKIFLLDYPWNQTDKLPKEITRVYSWNEIYNQIKK